MAIETYDLNGNTIYKVSDPDTWRLVHDGTTVILFILSSGTTQTPYTLEVFTEEQEGLDRINELDLIFNQEE